MKYKVIAIESDYEEVETGTANSVWVQPTLIMAQSF